MQFGKWRQLNLMELFMHEEKLREIEILIKKGNLVPEAQGISGSGEGLYPLGSILGSLAFARN